MTHETFIDMYMQFFSKHISLMNSSKSQLITEGFLRTTPMGGKIYINIHITIHSHQQIRAYDSRLHLMSFTTVFIDPTFPTNLAAIRCPSISTKALDSREGLGFNPRPRTPGAIKKRQLVVEKPHVTQKKSHTVDG